MEGNLMEGNLILNVGDMHEEEDGRIYVYKEGKDGDGSGDFVECGSAVKHIPLGDVPTCFFDYAERRRREAETDLVQVVGPEVAKVILEGRLRLSILLNSFGGFSLKFAPYSRLLNFVKSNGGIVDAYVSGNAASAAADLFLKADNRYCLGRSAFMWHCGRQYREGFESGPTRDEPSPDPEEREQIEAVKADYRRSQERDLRHAADRLVELSLKSNRERLHGHLHRIIDDESVPLEDREILFKGGHLDYLGVAKAFSSISGMGKQFLESTGLIRLLKFFS
ncbi:hypothetical protein HY604_02050 [Candidatus Peregrinibacteria bacterium]|nr:hypothetical protein [Candidatus Peregrinibacteria bacterium]